MDAEQKKQYMADWHQRNRDRRLPQIKERNKAYRAGLRLWIQQLKSETPCRDCKIKWPHYVMQFDHVGNDKEIDIANAVDQGWGRARIQREIDKCELVCANCHAIRTHSRRQGRCSSDGRALP